uniref:Dynamin (Trinotate prediction) n=1 Tax=Henneguya salminicola TaxID=69463 RepID=A0A6G3MGP6_HENSL
MTAKQKCLIFISRKDGQNITKNQRSIDLHCNNIDDLDSWMEAFVSAGIELDRSDEIGSIEKDVEDAANVEINKNVEYILLLINSYLDITVKNLQDYLSKITVLCIIVPLRKTILAELTAHLYSLGGIQNLMKESAQALEKRQKITGMYNCCKEALNTINTFINSADFEISASLKHLPKLSTKTNKTLSVPQRLPRSSSNTSLKNQAENTNISNQPTESISSTKTISSNNSQNVAPDRKKPKRPPPGSSGSKFYT